MVSAALTLNNNEKIIRLAMIASVLLHVIVLGLQNNRIRNIIQSSALNFDMTKTRVQLKTQKKVVTKPQTKKKVLKKKLAKKKVTPLPKPITPVKKEQPVSKVVNKDFKSSILKNIPPVYPRAALKRGWSGKVKLEIVVLPNGAVEEVKVLESSPFPILDKSATNAAKQWKFRSSPSGKNYLVHKTLVFEIKKG